MVDVVEASPRTGATGRSAEETEAVSWASTGIKVGGSPAYRWVRWPSTSAALTASKTRRRRGRLRTSFRLPPQPRQGILTIRAEILATATDYVTRDRVAAHGRAEDTFARIAALWSADLGIPLTGTDVARMMVLFKMARAKGNPAHEDNWVDAAGYSALGGEMATTA